MHADGHIYYLEQSLADLPDEDDWLSPADRSIVMAFHVDKRRSDWRLGRWTAKRTVCAYFGWTSERLRDIEIRSLASGAPKVTVPGWILAPEISISHSCGVCMCAIGHEGVSIGCDIEKLEERSQAFIETFFTADEISALASLSSDEKKILANIIWSTKESYLKSTREGLTRDTKDVCTIPPKTFRWRNACEGQANWCPIRISDGYRTSVAYWRVAAGFIETVSQFDAPIFSIIDISYRRLGRFSAE